MFARISLKLTYRVFQKSQSIYKQELRKIVTKKKKKEETAFFSVRCLKFRYNWAKNFVAKINNEWGHEMSLLDRKGEFPHRWFLSKEMPRPGLSTTLPKNRQIYAKYVIVKSAGCEGSYGGESVLRWSFCYNGGRSGIWRPSMSKFQRWKQMANQSAILSAFV